MASPSSALSLYMPKCSVCFSDARTSSHYLVQLSCYHFFCNYCVADVQQGGFYSCPFDRTPSTEYTFNNSVHERTNWLLTMWERLSDPQVQGQIQWLKTYVNYNHVFCRFEGCVQVVGGVPCPYSHFNLLASTPCPKAETCWRQQACPFLHQGSTHVNLVQTVSEGAWYTSTVQVQAQMMQGSITIRSRGAVEYLSSSNYSELHKIFQQVLGSVPQFNFRTQQVDYRSQVAWLYLPQSGQMQEFDSRTSQQLEQIYRMKGSVIIVDSYSSVYLNPMIRLYQNGGFEPVARLEKIHSTSDAGFLDVTCDAGYFNTLFQAVHSLEVEVPIGRIVPGEILRNVCQETGVSTRNEMLIGLAERLELASSILAADKTEVFSQILSVEAPQNYPYTLVKYLADCCTVIIAGNYIYGRSSEMSSFLSMLNYNYSSMQCPANITPQEVHVVCQRFGLMFENGMIAGPAENVREAFASLQAPQTMAVVPEDVDEARLRSLPSHVPVRVVGRRLEGTPENVQQALNVLPRKQQSIRYPVNLPLATVQQVARKYNVQINGQNLVGDQQSIMMTLNELNQLPAANTAGSAGGFQFAPSPAWYTQQTAELQKETLSPNSDEFKRVAARFNDTMGDESNIVGIERVQNRRLYTNFAYKYEAFCKVENRSIEIKELFHGTSTTDPAVIFQSDTGLDSRLGKGLWGNGTYYAENSYYSHDYCYHTPQRRCQMFLCSVIVGDYKEMPQDQTMVRPPQKPNSTACYHSVKGKTETSDIWITYEAAMSYPTWLITYEAEDRQYGQIAVHPAVLLMLMMMQAADEDDDN